MACCPEALRCLPNPSKSASYSVASVHGFHMAQGLQRPDGPKTWGQTHLGLGGTFSEPGAVSPCSRRKRPSVSCLSWGHLNVPRSPQPWHTWSPALSPAWPKCHQAFLTGSAEHARGLLQLGPHLSPGSTRHVVAPPVCRHVTSHVTSHCPGQIAP